MESMEKTRKTGSSSAAATRGATDSVLDIGSRRELFVDDALVERMHDVRRVLHRPIERNIAIVHDAPWEGNNSMFHTVFRDGDTYRLYYRGSQLDWHNGKVSYPHGQVACYAESCDGVSFSKPELGIVEFGGSAANNIILPAGPGTHNFSPFKDANPRCRPEHRYKALGGLKGLHAFASADSVHWSGLAEATVISEGAFDSQNLAFWDPVREEYRDYHRGFRDGRDILTCRSRDFLNWTEPQWLEYSPARRTELYTNQVIPYFRAPHILLGFPTRYITDRALLTPINRALAKVAERFGTDYTDTGLMSSRDGECFAVWDEAFIRPGPTEAGRWVYGDNYMAWGLVTTEAALPGAPDELSFYATEGAWRGTSIALRRYSLRLDGFVSVQAAYAGGELLSKPLTFEGSEMRLNMATSAAGSIAVELLDASSNAVIDGFALADCLEIFGDGVDQLVRWEGDHNLSAVAHRPVRIRFRIADADLYAFQFR